MSTHFTKARKMICDTNDSYIIPEENAELLEQCDITTFRSSGKGGQHVNKTESAVRLLHKPTGVVVISRKERSQYLNKKECLNNLRRKLEKRNTVLPPRIATKIPSSVKKRE